MPYWAGPVNWWTGYFTSFPAFKRSLRRQDALLRAAESAHAMARLMGIAVEDALHDGLVSARQTNGGPFLEGHA